MSSTRKGYKSFTVTNISYKGFYPDLDLQFEDSIGKTILDKWLGSDYTKETDTRSISFTGLTSNQRQTVKSKAREIYPEYIKSSSKRIPGTE